MPNVDKDLGWKEFSCTSGRRRTLHGAAESSAVVCAEAHSALRRAAPLELTGTVQLHPPVPRRTCTETTRMHVSSRVAAFCFLTQWNSAQYRQMTASCHRWIHHRNVCWVWKLVSKDCPFCVILFVHDSHLSEAIAVRTVTTTLIHAVDKGCLGCGPARLFCLVRVPVTGLSSTRTRSRQPSPLGSSPLTCSLALGTFKSARCIGLHCCVTTRWVTCSNTSLLLKFLELWRPSRVSLVVCSEYQGQNQGQNPGVIQAASSSGAWAPLAVVALRALRPLFTCWLVVGWELFSAPRNGLRAPPP